MATDARQFYTRLIFDIRLFWRLAVSARVCDRQRVLDTVQFDMERVHQLLLYECTTARARLGTVEFRAAHVEKLLGRTYALLRGIV